MVQYFECFLNWLKIIPCLNVILYYGKKVLMRGKLPHNKGGHCPFRKSLLDSQTFVVAGPIGLWPRYHSRWFVWLALKLKNK